VNTTTSGERLNEKEETEVEFMQFSYLSRPHFKEEEEKMNKKKEIQCSKV
jgi:hypothetical protein